MSLLVSLVVGFASGVFLRSLFFISPWVYGFGALLIILSFSAWVLRPRPEYLLAALACLTLLMGIARVEHATREAPLSFLAELRHRVAYTGTVVAEPDVRDTNVRIPIEVARGADTTRILVVAPRDTQVGVGDRVFVAGTLYRPEPFATEQGRTFHYDTYLARDGIFFILRFAYVRVDTPAPWYSVPAFLTSIKQRFIEGLERALPEPTASLAGGLLVGGKAGLGSEVQHDFVQSGLIQIVVLSGYNVMIVAEWVMRFFAACRLSRKKSVVMGAVSVLVFVGIAGWSAPALRAALMAMIALYARGSGRTYAAGRALLVVVFGMLAYNPLLLVFDPGFGLSVAATAGLIWLAPILECLKFARPTQRNGLRFWRVCQVQRSETLSENAIRSGVATTLAAQIAVLPLLLYETGTLSLVTLPASMLVLPLVPLTMALSALAGLAGMLFAALPMDSILLALPAYLFGEFILTVARISAHLPFAAFVLPPFPFWGVVLTYAALIAASYRFSTTLQLRLVKKASI